MNSKSSTQILNPKSKFQTQQAYRGELSAQAKQTGEVTNLRPWMLNPKSLTPPTLNPKP
jgi:hypothetical protein